MQVGPEWIKTPLKSSDAPTPVEWKMTLPIYDPAATASFVTFYQRSPNAKPTEVFPYARSHTQVGGAGAPKGDLVS